MGQSSMTITDESPLSRLRCLFWLDDDESPWDASDFRFRVVVAGGLSSSEMVIVIGPFELDEPLAAPALARD
jgi:hypothetical protein